MSSRSPTTTKRARSETQVTAKAARLPRSSDSLKQPAQFQPPPPKNDSVVPPSRVWYSKLVRFSPIRQITPEQLSTQLDQFAAGSLRLFALTMDAIARRDDILQTVIPKRVGAVSRRTIEVMPDPDADQAEAKKHAEVLKYFYKHARATNAVDMNQKRGTSLLVEQMLNAQLFRYAVHEILWEPSPEGLTATFNFVPLWFFENRSGVLRFLKEDFAYDGVDLEDGAWMVTVGQGVMEAAAVAYMFKKLSLQDWLMYCQKHGSPGIQGKTQFAQGTEGWNNMVDAVSKIAADFSVVTSKDDEIETLDFSNTGELPYPKMVERMDRALTALLRGADLSTMSAQGGKGQGASLQGKESHIVETDDAALVSETLQMNVDRLVIEYYFGEGTKPAAKTVVVVPPEQNVNNDLAIDDKLVQWGCKVGKKETLDRYGRSAMDPGDEPLEKAAVPVKIGGGKPGAENADNTGDETTEEANERSPGGVARQLLVTSDRLFEAATLKALQPLVERILGVMELPDDQFDDALARLRADAPAIMEAINADPANAAVLRKAINAGWFNGVING